jgi:hypothetical protein
MEQLIEYRQQLLKRLEESAREFRVACQTAASRTVASEADEWNVHQIAVHTRDTEKLVYGLRIRQSLEEDNPFFQNFDGDAWIAEHYDPNEPLASALDELVDSVTRSVARLRDLPPEAWTRPSQHETYGAGFTTQTWVERSLAHIEEHLKTVTGNQ